MFRMTRRAGSAAAAAPHSFSSLPSPPTGKLSSLFLRSPDPPPPNSRIPSLSTTPVETTSSYPENPPHESIVGVSKARLKKFFQTNCKSGDVSADEAIGFYHCMIQMEPRFSNYSFNLLLNGLAKNKRYSDAFSLYGNLEASRELFNRLSEKHVRPNDVTYNVMMQGLCKEGQVEEAYDLFLKMENEGCSPTTTTYNIILRGFAEKNQIEKVVEVLHKMVENKVSPDVLTRCIVFDLLSKDKNFRNCLHLLPTFPIEEKYHDCLHLLPTFPVEVT